MSQENLMINEIVVTIADNNSRPVTFKTVAKTLGELKTELNSRGINYDNKVFREGNSVTELLNDETLLPRFKGDRPLTELFIMLTTAKKHVNSGIDPEKMTRMELIAACTKLVQERPELKAEFGSITITKSVTLIDLYKKHTNQETTKNDVSIEEKLPTTPNKPEISKISIDNEWVKIVGIKCLEGVIEAMKAVPLTVYAEVVKSSFSQEDINKMVKLLQD